MPVPATQKKRPFPPLGKKKKFFPGPHLNSVTQAWGENFSQAVLNDYSLGFFDNNISKDYKAHEFHYFKFGGGAKARENYVLDYIVASPNQDEADLLDDIYQRENLSANPWVGLAKKPGHIHGEGNYQVGFKIRDFVSPGAAVERELKGLAYQAVYRVAEAQLYRGLTVFGKNLDSQINDLSTLNRNLGKEWKELTEFKQVREERFNLLQQRRGRALTADESKKLVDLNKRHDDIRQRKKHVWNKRHGLDGEIVKRRDALDRVNKELLRLNPKAHEWLAPRRGGQTLFSDRGGHNSGGRLWQVQDFINDPLGYSVRSFIWKGDPLPGGKRFLELKDSVTGDVVGGGIRDQIFKKYFPAGKTPWGGEWKGLESFIRESPLSVEKWQGLRDFLFAKPIKPPTPASPPAPAPAPVPTPTPAAAPTPIPQAGLPPGWTMGPGGLPLAPPPGTPPPALGLPPGWTMGPGGLPLAPPPGAVPPIVPPLPAGPAAPSALQTLGSGITQFLGDLGSSLQSAIQSIAQSIGPILQQIMQFLTQLLQQVLQWMMQMISQVLPHLLGFGGAAAGGGAAATAGGVAAGGVAAGAAAGGTAAGGTAALAAEELATGVATGGVKPAVEIIAVIVAVVVGIFLVLAVVFVFIFIFLSSAALKDYGQGGAVGSQLTLTKTVDVLDAMGSPTGTNRIPTLDGQAHRVLYRITMSNGSSSSDAENITLYDNQCGQTFTPPTLPRNRSAEIGTCEIEVIADLDRVVINEVTGTATMDGSQVNLHTSGILIIGDPADVPPFGWPISEGCISQGPGGSFSHTQTGNVYGNALDIYPSSDEGYNIRATHAGTAQAYYSTPTVGDGPYPGFGYYVVVTSVNGSFSSVYAHMESISVSDGQAVAAGELLGRVDSTVGPGGTSTGDHIHYALSSLTMDAPYIPAHVPACAGDCGAYLNLNAGQNCFKP